MSLGTATWSVRDRRGNPLAVITWGTVAIGTAEVASVATMVGVAAAHASRSALWPAALVIVLAAVAVALPDSAAGLITFLGYGAWWLAAVRTAPWPAVLVVAVAGLVLHVALAHAAAAPAGAVVRAAVAGSPARDLALVVALTGGAALAATVIDRWGVRGPSYLIGLALVLIGLLPWIAVDAPGGGRRRR